MKIFRRTWKCAGTLLAIMLLMSAMTVFATGSSGDNSLASLGIEDAEVTPDFYYSTVEYDVVVPAGTTELKLNPQPSDSSAEISAISGTTLQDGQGTVTITVRAGDGSQAVYTLHVTSAEGETAAVTEAQSETQTATTASTDTPQTEDQSQETIQKLNAKVDDLNSRISLGMKVMYGLVGFAVVLLFIIINLVLKNKDLKDDLREAEGAIDFNANEFARKEKNMSTDYYYAPVQEMQPSSVNAPGVQVEKVQEATLETFGNAEAKAKIRAEKIETPIERELEKAARLERAPEIQPQPQVYPVKEVVIPQKQEDDDSVDVDMIDL